ncbi:hypothetical protein Golax_012256, partial [Gossypium laxum]|nr:hypothetical protein [Gossypium laxum]
VRVAARFHSHCPQTARLYYHPPPNSQSHPNPDANHSTPMAKFGSIVIQVGVNKKHPHYRIIKAILKELPRKDWRWHLQYIPRQCNFLADWVAKRSIQDHVEFTVFEGSPQGVINLLMADDVGIAFNDCLAFALF